MKNLFKTALNLLTGVLAGFATSACMHSASLPDPVLVQDDLIIRNVTAIDAVNGVHAAVDVGIRQGRISYVRGTRPSPRKSGAAVIDGTGKYLIPGLWDAHVHLAYDSDIDHRVFFPLSLAHGVTYLRDTGGKLEKLAEARNLASRSKSTPDLYVSGPLVDGPQRVYAGQSAGFPDLSIGVDTPEQAIQKVDFLASQGVDFIKAYEMLAPDVFRAVVQRADHHGLPVTGHSPLSMTAMQATEAGIADMQHLRNLEMDCVANPGSYLRERKAIIAADQAEFGGKLRSSLHRLQRGRAVEEKDDGSCAVLIARMKEKGVSQTPTLTISRFLSRRLFAEKRWQDTFALMPKSVASSWTERAERISSGAPTERDIAYDRWLMTMVADLNEAGVSILAGTDAPIGYLTPGISLHEELAMLVEAGLTPLQAIGAATIAPAEFLNLQHLQGTIASGMKADMILLEANPLENIRNTLAIHAVFKDGSLIDRQKLDQLAGTPANID